MSQVQKLQQAGLIPDPSKLTDADTAKVNALSDAEVNALISVKQQLGDDFLTQNVVRSANCFI
ncbi:MAG TPA: aroma-sacti cluster domain-containing protein [Terriglobia bacterium]|nr:aroma-sacti cluster domain-containing protein [Terriglobia bacterium]